MSRSQEWSQIRYCDHCDLEFDEYYHGGACPDCNGFGVLVEVDVEPGGRLE